MLITIKEKTQGIIAGIIIFLIIIPFALWGVNSYFSGNSTVIVAEGDGVKVTQQDLRKALDRVRGNVPPQAWESQFFKQQVLDEMVQEQLFIKDIRDNNYRVSDEQLSKQIKTLPYFQDDSGKFSKERYEAALRGQGLSSSMFESQSRSRIITQQVSSGYGNSEIITEDAINDIVKLKAQQRKFSYAEIDPNDFKASVKLSDAEIESFYQGNAQQFKTQEQVQIEYIQMSAKELADNYKPTDDEIRQAYDDGTVQNFVTPEKRKVSHILIEAGSTASAEEVTQALEKIKSIQTELKSGASFSALAKKHSKDPGSAAKGGDLGFINPGEMVPEFEQAAYKLKKGEISEPVKTKYGYHLIKLTDFVPENKKKFKDVKAELSNILTRLHGEERFYDLSEQFYNLTYENPDSLKPAAENLGLKIQKSAWFTSAGGAGIAANPGVISAAFSPEVLEQGRNSDTVEIDETTFVALRIADHRKASTRPLVEVKAQVISILKQQKATAAANELRAKIKDALQNGKALSALAKENKLKYFAKKTHSRSDKDSSIDKQLLAAVFSAKRPAAEKPEFGSVVMANQRIAVFALTEIRDGEINKIEPTVKTEVRQQLVSRSGRENFSAYRAGLRESAKVDINTENF